MQELYTKYKGLIFTIAYQMTGSATDADDVVQDVFLKAYSDNSVEQLEFPKAYLCKMATNRCRDLLKSARKKREQYFGEWLPEPIRTSDVDMDESVIRNELLSYAMLVLLERLTPSERIVFVLREAIGFDYADIAGMTGKSELNCRKLFSRAKGKMGIEKLGAAQSEAASEEWVRQFLSALEQDNVEGMVSMLAEDVELIADGGGKATAAVHPIVSRDRVIRFILGLFRSIPKQSGETKLTIEPINGQAGIVVRTDGVIETIVLWNRKNDPVSHFYFIRNPDKLVRFGDA